MRQKLIGRVKNFCSSSLFTEQHEVDATEAHRRHPQQGEAFQMSALSKRTFRTESTSGM